MLQFSIALNARQLRNFAWNVLRGSIVLSVVVSIGNLLFFYCSSRVRLAWGDTGSFSGRILLVRVWDDRTMLIGLSFACEDISGIRVWHQESVGIISAVLWFSNFSDFRSVRVHRLSDWFWNVLVRSLLPYQAELGAINDLIINDVLLDCWEFTTVSSFLLLLALKLLWLKMINWFGNVVFSFSIDFLDWLEFDGHRLRSFESSWLILGGWEPISDHTKVSWASDGG